MVAAANVLAELVAEGVIMWIDGDQLKCKPAGDPLSPAQRDRIRAHRAGLMALLAAPVCAPVPPRATGLLAILRALNERWAMGRAWLAADSSRARRATGRFREIAAEAATVYDELDAIAPRLLDGFELFPEFDRCEADDLDGPDLLAHFANAGGWIGACEHVGEAQADALLSAVQAWLAARGPGERGERLAAYRLLVLEQKGAWPWAL